MFKTYFRQNLGIYSKIFFLVLPIVLSSFLQHIVSAVDNFMVATVSKDQDVALTAVGICSQLVVFAISFFWGVNAVAAIFANQFIGAKQFANFKDTIKINVFLNLILAIFSVTILLTVGSQIVDLYIKTQPSKDQVAIKALTDQYLPILTGSIFFVALSVGYIQPIIIIGKAKFYFYVGLISLINNVVFNLIFVYVFKLGVAGIAWSTLLARFLECAFIWGLVLFKFRSKLMFQFDWWFNRKIIRAFFTKIILATSFLVQFAANILFAWLFMTKYPEVASAIGISGAIIGIMFAMLPGVVMSINYFVGQALGANKFQLAQDYVKKIYFLLVILTLGFVAFVMLLTWVIVPAVVANSYYITFMISVYAAFMVVFTTNFTLATALRSGGMVALPIFFNQYFQTIFIFPITYLFAHFFAIDFKYVYVLPLSLNLLPTLILYLVYRQKKWVRNITKAFRHRPK